MASKALLLLGLFAAVVLLIVSEVAARDMAETSHTSAQNTKVEDASKAAKTPNKVDQVNQYGGYPGGGYGGGPGGGYGGGPGGGYGGGPGGGYGGGPGYGGYPGGGYGGGRRGYGRGYCRYGCCYRGYNSCRRCCNYAGEAVETQVHN